MVASKSAQTATSGVGSRARVNARARKVRTPIEGGFVRSRYAPASEQTIAAAALLLDRRREALIEADETETSVGRKVAAAIGVLALTAATGVFAAALIAGTLAGIIVTILSLHR